MSNGKNNRNSVPNKKKTSIGKSHLTKCGKPGPNGGNKTYRKKYRGQGR